MNEIVTLVESHVVKNNSLQSKELKEICFKSKNLYNQALYRCRQNFFKNHTGLSYETLYEEMKNDEDYRSLPAKVSQQTLKQTALVFKSFINALKAYKKDPKKFLGEPKLPHYKDKTKGQFITTYTNQAVFKNELKNGIIHLSMVNLRFKTKQDNIQQVRIIPKKTHFVVEVVYYKECINKKLNKDNVFSLDLGVNNLLTITSNKKGFQPIVVNGRIVKSVNQYYNKQKAYLQSLLPKDVYSTKRISKISNKRSRKIKHYFHHVSKFLVDLCIKEDVGTIVIGKNDGWKQECNMSKRSNQNFVSIPFQVLINQINYKSELVGIEVIEHEESYTSKCSFLDLEEVGKHEEYLGYRKKRGMFKSRKFGEINADVNGSYNIGRKVFPRSFDEGIEGFVVNPVLYTACTV